MPFSVIVAGGRNFNNYELLKRRLDYFLSAKSDVRIISGDARGVDKLGKRYAEEHGIPCLVMPADWDKNGKQAGYIRNKEMADAADALVAFWDGQSRGTEHMIRTMKDMGKPFRIVCYDPKTMKPMAKDEAARAKSRYVEAATELGYPVAEAPESTKGGPQPC